MKRIIRFCISNNTILATTSTVVTLAGLFFKINFLFFIGFAYIFCCVLAINFILLGGIFVARKPQYKDKLNNFLEDIDPSPKQR